MTHLAQARGRFHRPVLQDRMVVRMAAVAAALTLVVSAALPGRAQQDAKQTQKNTKPSTPLYLANGSVELGGHMITKSGSMPMWATLVNQSTGPRILEASLFAHSTDTHKTPFFDSL